MKYLYLSLLMALQLLLPLPLKASYGSPTAFVTAYNLAGIMANGRFTHYGAVACKQTFRLGTSVHIEGLGDFVCEDRFGDENMLAMFDISLPYASLNDCYAITGYYNWWVI